MRGSREISLVPSLHRASTDALISPSHHLWVKTISVNQESTQDQHIIGYIQTTLSGMAKAAVAAVPVAHSTILHTSLNNSPAPPLTL